MFRGQTLLDKSLSDFAFIAFEVGESLLVRVVSIQQPGKLVLSAKPIEIEVDLEPFQPVARQDHFLSGVLQPVAQLGDLHLH